jgi:NADP-dependent 3-hydroxy acid dehydrogenase YdfG
MERWINRVAIVTGASGGIGKAITIALLKSGMVVVGIARREDLLVVSAHIYNTIVSQLSKRIILIFVVFIKS